MSIPNGSNRLTHPQGGPIPNGADPNPHRQPPNAVPAQNGVLSQAQAAPAPVIAHNLAAPMQPNSLRNGALNGSDAMHARSTLTSIGATESNGSNQPNAPQQQQPGTTNPPTLALPVTNGSVGSSTPNGISAQSPSTVNHNNASDTTAGASAGNSVGQVTNTFSTFNSSAPGGLDNIFDIDFPSGTDSFDFILSDRDGFDSDFGQWFSRDDTPDLDSR